jgi:DNA-binding NtrC family response regulator
VSESKPHLDATTAHLPTDADRRRRLLVFWPGGTVQHDVPDRGTIVLGRGAECDVRIDHASVSRRHATLHVGQGYTLEDHGSSNGTTVDGRKVPEGKSVQVSAGQEILLGSTTLVLPPTPVTAQEAPSPSAATLGPAMRELYDTVELVAKGKIPVLVVGETGVGKELVVREIHRRSPRAARSFSMLACATLPEALIEAELFGLVEMAAGGTLVLDEVSAMPLATQAKLLRILESGEVVRLGSTEPQRIDVRFVATSNRDLEQLVAAGGLRSDLYYRLNGAKLVVPPLRERRTEIAPLARQFAGAAAAEVGAKTVSITAPALLALERYDWPGNVRELRNVVQRAVLVSRGAPIGIEHIGLSASPAAGPRMPSVPAPGSEPAQPVPPAATGDLRTQLNEIERERILDALARCDGNQSQAAKLLGMPRRTLISRLEAHQLPRPRKKSDDS